MENREYALIAILTINLIFWTILTLSFIWLVHTIQKLNKYVFKDLGAKIKTIHEHLNVINKQANKDAANIKTRLTWSKKREKGVINARKRTSKVKS